MPRAKRNKVVSLTRVKKDVHATKESLVDKVRTYLNHYSSATVLTYQNMTTNPFKQLKEKLKDSKFCLGKNKVMAVAIGRNEEQSYKPSSFMLSEYLRGQCCLFFSNYKLNDIRALFNQFEVEQFAQAGTVAQRTIILEKGFGSLKKFPHSMETHLRGLGLNVRLMNSEIQLLENSIVCQEGKPISVKGSKLLRLLDIKMGKFKLKVKAFYDTKKYYFTKLQ